MTFRSTASKALKYVFTGAVVLGGGYGVYSAYSYVTDHYATDSEIDLTHHTTVSSQKEFDEKSTQEAARVAFFSIEKCVNEAHGGAKISTLGEGFKKTTDTITGTDAKNKVTRFSIIYNTAGSEIARAVCRADLSPAANGEFFSKRALYALVNGDKLPSFFAQEPLYCSFHVVKQAKPKP